MKRKPFVYVAGPISTGGDFIGNCRRGIHIGERLRREGFIPFVPHLSVIHELVTEAISWDQWLEYDEQIILRCDAIYRMQGDSKGADREVKFAEENGIPVFQSIMGLRGWCLSDFERRDMVSIKPTDPEVAPLIARLETDKLDAKIVDFLETIEAEVSRYSEEAGALRHELKKAMAATE